MSRPRRYPKLRSQWALLALILTVLGLGLLALSPARLATADLYAPKPSGSDDTVPAALREGGPGIGVGNGALTTIKAKPRTIALTFDDGPDPVWTPQVLSVLDKYHVHGTFFVLGDQVIQHPGITADLQARGHEFGVHTFTHVNLSRADAGRIRLEARATQLLIQGATGRTTALLRPPFSSTNAAVDDSDWAAMQVTASAGYLTVLTTLDPEDWRVVDTDAIVRQVVRADESGQVVLFHDGGGDRSHTVEALDQLIPALQSRGYQVGTVSEAMGLTSASLPAPLNDRLLGALVLWGLWACIQLVSLAGVLMVAAGVLTVSRALVLLVSARRQRKIARGRRVAWDAGPVTVIMPAYNEEAGIEAAVRSVVASTHPVEVIVVDDGSTDETASVVQGLDLPGVRLITQRNAGKPAALNTGLQDTRTELVVMVDGDTIFEPDTVEKLIGPFADPQVGAVSGNAKVANRKGFLGRWQHIEYVIGFNMDRRFYDLAGCMPTVPGAVGGFRVEALREVGLVSSDTLAEDTDLTMALGCAGWRIVYADDARAWTEVPATLGALWRQRYRWCYGTMQAMWKHRAALRDRGYAGRYARRSLGYMVMFQIVLPLLAPAVDLFTLYGLLVLDPRFGIGVWLAFQTVDLIVAQAAFRADRERLRVLWALPFTQFCYRQLLYLVVIQSLATAVAGTRLNWQRVERYGTFSTQPGAVA